ncbi:MAG: hypothetical protein ACI4Q6_03565 [Huintestinicola sp.]
MKKLFGTFFGLLIVVFELIGLLTLIIVGTDLISRYFEDKNDKE